MSVETILLILVVVAGFYMAWSIGANDVANAMGTSVGSGALTLKKAVLIAAVLEFSGAFFFGSHVSETIQNKIIDSSFFTNTPLILACGMLSSLIGAGIWMQLATYNGWPVSTTHSIIGAVVGFGLAVGGVSSIYWESVLSIAFSWILSPLLGGIIAFLIFTLLRQLVFYSSNPVLAAKRLAPLLIFIVTLPLFFLVLLDTFQRSEVTFAGYKAFFLSLFLTSSLAILIYSYFYYRLPAAATNSASSLSSAREISTALNKAKKHLFRLTTAHGREDLKKEASESLKRLESLSPLRQSEESLSSTHAEYTVVENIFGKLQIMTACMMAFAHGANDVANAIGPLSAAITLILYKNVAEVGFVPSWALALGGIGIVIGLATWGWRVIETIGKKITLLTPSRGFAAEFGAALVVAIASRLGMPISTTHTLVGAVIGVGLARGLGSLDISTTRNILISWLITIPAGALFAIASYLIISSLLGL